MNYLITGASGLVGSELLKQISDPVWVTTRNAEDTRAKLGLAADKVVAWDPLSGTLPQTPPIDVVINLMGESVAHGRWTAKKKKRITQSRVLGTKNLVESFKKMPARPRVLVNASAVGYYPDRGDDWQDETYPRGSGFLPEVCAAWEHAAMEAEHLGVRVVVIRIGLVMSARGGALKEMLTPFRWGVGGRLGSGKQWMPWVHLEDLARMFIWAAENPEVHGVINGVSPNPVTNREFTAMLAQKINRPAWVTAPQYFLKLILGEFADSLFVSQRVNPAKPIDLGFQYRFPELKQAFADLLNDD